MNPVFFAFLALLSTLALAACGPDEPPVGQTGADGFTHTVTLAVEYYKDGPQQGSPPDGTLESGTKVKIIEEAGSYVLIKASNGVDAFISADAISPIAP